ncbi:MAG: hypothetical protein JJT81_05600 [Rubellimicrobium sp.]|nr:hypothetical protein [Rubellimicrobium sp.]
MIFPLAGLVMGALTGGMRAKRRGGTRADIAQWAAVHGIIFGLAGLFLLIWIERSLQ